MVTKNTQPELVTFTSKSAEQRSDAWKLLYDSGAPLLWHPVAIDKVLNASEHLPIVTLEDAVSVAVKNEPYLPDAAEDHIAYLKGKVEGAPFWKRYISRAALRSMPACYKKQSGLMERCESMLWDKAVDVANKYAPVGIGASGELRPYYYQNYLRTCFENNAREIVKFCFESNGRRIDDPEDRSQYADPSDLDPSVTIENTECRTILLEALQSIRGCTRLEKVFDLVVSKGFTIREASNLTGLGKSTMQRDSQALALLLQRTFAVHYGIFPKGNPDAESVINAVRLMILDGLNIPSLNSAGTGTSKVIRKPITVPMHSDTNRDHFA